ncbi:MAG: NADP-dependent oxidoreductase [Bermanella sp.]
MNQLNKVIRLVKRPEGKPTMDVFQVDHEPIEKLKSGEYRMRNLCLSMDPALVGRMRDEDNYVGKVELGEVMHSYGLGQVIESKNPKVKVGGVRLGQVNMQEYAVFSDEEACKEINLGLTDLHNYLGAVGITGATAYFALQDIGRPKAGETVLISSGGSSVGSIAAQIANNLGCKTVAIVSTEEKTKQVKQDFGFTQAVSYRGKSIEQLSRDIKKACPDGVDVYFDNTSGDISEATLDNLNLYSRIVVVGRLAISHLADTTQDTGRRYHNIMLTNRVKKQGFVVLDYQDRMRGAFIRLARWIKEGKINGKEDVMHGIENIPHAFFRMLDGKSAGKQLVKLAEVDDALDKTPRWLGRLLTSRFFPTEKLAKKITGGI